MAKIGIMIEGQEDLTWERLFRLADAATLCRSLMIPFVVGKDDTAVQNRIN